VLLHHVAYQTMTDVLVEKFRRCLTLSVTNLQVIQHEHITASSLKDVFESVNNQNAIDFVEAGLSWSFHQQL